MTSSNITLLSLSTASIITIALLSIAIALLQSRNVLKMSTAVETDKMAALATAANEARGLAMDSIAAAHSGHMGLPLGAAEIGASLWGSQVRSDPKKPYSNPSFRALVQTYRVYCVLESQPPVSESGTGPCQNRTPNDDVLTFSSSFFLSLCRFYSLLAHINYTTHHCRRHHHHDE
jgi:hypothetical protein